MLLRESESITLGVNSDVKTSGRKNINIFLINLLALFIDLITKIFGFQNSLFS